MLKRLARSALLIVPLLLLCAVPSYAAQENGHPDMQPTSQPSNPTTGPGGVQEPTPSTQPQTPQTPPPATSPGSGSTAGGTGSSVNFENSSHIMPSAFLRTMDRIDAMSPASFFAALFVAMFAGLGVLFVVDKRRTMFYGNYLRARLGGDGDEDGARARYERKRRDFGVRYGMRQSLSSTA